MKREAIPKEKTREVQKQVAGIILEKFQID